MAWRLQDLVVEGEIDNTTKGIVTGWIQFSDRPDRVRLCLRGDCHPDLAGWRFKIKRRRPVPLWAEPADSTPLAAEQSGHAGDIPATKTSRSGSAWECWPSASTRSRDRSRRRFGACRAWICSSQRNRFRDWRSWMTFRSCPLRLRGIARCASCSTRR